MSDEFAALREAEAAARERRRAAGIEDPEPTPRAPEKIQAKRFSVPTEPPERAALRLAWDADRTKTQRDRQIARMTACIPTGYAAARLGTESLRKRVRFSTTAIADTERALGESTIVWTGLSGSGKSSLACAAIRGRAEREADSEWARGRFMFLRASELAVASKHQSLGEGTPELVRSAIDADLVVIDELGSEPRSPHWQDVEDVVFARYERALPTWFTTWTTLDDIASRYGDGFARRVFGQVNIDCGGAP